VNTRRIFFNYFISLLLLLLLWFAHLSQQQTKKLKSLLPLNLKITPQNRYPYENHPQNRHPYKNCTQNRYPSKNDTQNRNPSNLIVPQRLSISNFQLFNTNTRQSQFFSVISGSMVLSKSERRERGVGLENKSGEGRVHGEGE
jgi:hypothetical protein